MSAHIVYAYNLICTILYLAYCSNNSFMCTSISIYYGSKFSTGTAVKHTTVSFTVYCTYIALHFQYPICIRTGASITRSSGPTLLLTYSTTCSALVLTIASYISDRIHSHSFYLSKPPKLRSNSKTYVSQLLRCKPLHTYMQ